VTNPRVFELGTSAGAVLFRLPGRIEMVELWDGLPILPETTEESVTVVDARPAREKVEEARKALTFADRLLSTCAKKPRISLLPCISTAELLDVADLSDEERFALMREILARNGFSLEEAERVAPLEVGEQS